MKPGGFFKEHGIRGDLVVVPYPQRAPADAIRVVIAGEREMVLAFSRP
jgi:hypothetical protein